MADFKVVVPRLRDLAKADGLDEPALHELVGEIRPHLLSFEGKPPEAQQERRPLFRLDTLVQARKARARMRRLARVAEQAETKVVELQTLLSEVLCDGWSGRDPRGLPALAEGMSAAESRSFFKQLDALSHVREQVLPVLRRFVDAAVPRLKKTAGRPEIPREIGKLAQAFWEGERKRIRSKGGKDIGPATCYYDYESRDGADMDTLVEGDNKFSVFFGKLMKDLAGWDVPTCKTSLGRWDGTARAR